MANAQKDKGKRFERDVAKFLTDTFNKPFMRVPNSGAFTGGKNQSRIQTMSETQVKSQRGDIIAPDEYNFIVECKNHRDFSTGFAGILLGNNKKLNGWLDEVYKDAQNGQIPYSLAFKITGQTASIYFALPEAHFSLNLSQNVYARYKHRELWYNIISAQEFKVLKAQIEKTLLGGKK